MERKLPKPLLWIFESYSLTNKKYIDELDFIKANMSVNHIAISPRNGVSLNNLQQCHQLIKEITEYAHKIGLEISLHLVPYSGFYNAVFLTGNHPAIDQAELFPIDNPQKAEAIVNDIELTADENGFASGTHKAVWGRKKIMPIFSEILKAYSFEKTEDGFYKEGTLQEVTDRILITNSRTNLMDFEIDLGKQNAGKNIFVMVAQYYNYTAVSDTWDVLKGLIDAYSDIDLDGIQLDEYGYMFLNTNSIANGDEPPFRGRIYSKGMNKYYSDNLNIDLANLMFEMRYAPENNEKIRIKAINTYFEQLRYFPLEIEKKAYSYAKQVFGDDIYISCHNTFHNDLDNDEIWRTACNWWDIPRDYGHTDENITFPVRWGMMLAAKNPLMFDMYYSSNGETHFDHMIEAAPYNCREFHHAFDDFYWGNSFTEPEFLKKIRTLDDTIATLDKFQTEYPKMDLLVIFGAAAQNNWYPDYEARNLFDIDGSLKILEKCNELWNLGYRCALAPDYAIEDGRILLNGDKICFNGYEFSHCIFLYPKYAKKGTYDFLNQADMQGLKLAVVGKSGIDFEGNAAVLTAPHFEKFSLEIAEKIGCVKSAIKDGCIYTDGSFSLVNKGLIDGGMAEFDFEINGKHYNGKHTGLLAYRENMFAFSTSGSELFVDGVRIDLHYISSEN